MDATPVPVLAPVAISEDERAAIIEAVRDFAQSELAPHALEWDRASHFPRETLGLGGELGLGGIYVREDVGGSGLSRSDAAAIFEELAKGDPAIAAYISIHNMVAWMIDTYATDAQRQEWLPLLTSMQGFGSYCLTEPGAGSDAAAIATSAIRSGDEYVLTGVKQFISGGGEASVYIVMARTDADAGARGITAFLVPAETAGLSFGQLEHKMGWNAQPTRQVILDEVRVPAANILGVEGRHRDLEALPLAAEDVRGGHAHLVEDHLPRRLGVPPHLLLDGTERQA